MHWEVEYTEEFERWWNELTEIEQEKVAVAVKRLEEHGPALARPWVDTIKASRYNNMKELRPLGGNLRVLFAFDPRRIAILLIGGDKTGRWQEFYKRLVPLADDLYDEHLLELRTEGEL